MAFAKPAGGDILVFVKQNFWKIVLLVYLVVSFLFIVRYMYSNVLVGYYYNGGIQQGVTQVLSEIAAALDKSNCQPVTIPVGNQNYPVVQAGCLSQPPLPATPPQ